MSDVKGMTIDELIATASFGETLDDMTNAKAQLRRRFAEQEALLKSYQDHFARHGGPNNMATPADIFNQTFEALNKGAKP